MNINELVEAKRNLETNLRASIAKELEDFNASTGQSIHRVDVNLTTAYSVGGSVRHLVTGVEVEFQLQKERT